MKRSRITTSMALLLAATAAFTLAGDVHVAQVFDKLTWTGPSTNRSVAIPLDSYKLPAWQFSVQLVATNMHADTELSLALEHSLDGSYWFATNIVTAFTNKSGRGVGSELYTLTVQPARFVRLRAIAAASNGVADAWLLMR